MTVRTTYKLVPAGNLTANVLSSDSFSFDMAGNASGTVEFSHSGSTSEMDGTVLNSRGTRVAGPFTIATGGSNYDPAVAALSNGSFVTAYDHLDAGGQNTTINLQITTAAGQKQGTTFAVDGFAGDQTDPDVAGLTNGDVVVSWTRGSNANNASAQFEVFGADGSKVVSGAVASTPGIATSGTSVAGLTNGGFVVAFSQLATGATDKALEFQLFDAGGTATGNKVEIDTTGNNDQVQALGLKDGGFALAYRDNGFDGVNTDIALQLFNADGSKRGKTIEVNLSSKNNDTANDQLNPSITQLSNGLIAISWESFTGSGYDINARLYNANGRPLTDITTLGTSTALNSNALAAQLLGGFESGWTAYNSTTKTYETHGGHVDFVRYLTGDNTSETIKGGRGIDVVTANGGNDKVYLYGSNDKADGGAGNDLIRGGNGNDVIMGGTGNDTLYGDAGNDVLAGNSGKNTLFGGAGADTFVFNAGIYPANLQTIEDFTVGSDKLFLDSSLYSKAVGSSVNNYEFTTGTHATKSYQHLIYDGGSGALYFDADGSGSKAQVEIAQLGKNLNLSAGDFKVGHFTF